MQDTRTCADASATRPGRCLAATKAKNPRACTYIHQVRSTGGRVSLARRPGSTRIARAKRSESSRQGAYSLWRTRGERRGYRKKGEERAGMRDRQAAARSRRRHRRRMRVASHRRGGAGGTFCGEGCHARARGVAGPAPGRISYLVRVAPPPRGSALRGRNERTLADPVGPSPLARPISGA